MRVLKFGGSSIGDADAARGVVEIVAGRQREATVLVFSAVGGTTDRLENIGDLASASDQEGALSGVAELRRIHLALVERLGLDRRAKETVWKAWQPLFDDLAELAGGAAALGQLPDTDRARLLGFGELLSTHLMTAALRAAGVPTRWVDARDSIVTEGRSLDGRPLLRETRTNCQANVLPLVEAGLVPVIQGFIARSATGKDTTLGRGGSDCTAALVAAALAADEVEIWTDVDGVLSADPELVPGARRVPRLSFQEAAELAFFGARVLHPGTVAPALDSGVPVRVRSSRRPELPGTLILAQPRADGGLVKSIASKRGLTVINITPDSAAAGNGRFEGVFRILDHRRVSPELVATSRDSIAIAVAQRLAGPQLLAELGELGRVTTRDRQAAVAVVGDRLREEPGIVGEVFTSLGELRVSLVSMGGSDLSLGFIIDESHLTRAVRRLHRGLIEAAPGSVTLVETPRPVALGA
jgi:aspartate kinase